MPQGRERPGRDFLVASMRPGPIGPGNLPISSSLSSWRHASMRPGPIGPGNRVALSDGERIFLASMRPGPIGPGNASGLARRFSRHARFNEARPNWAGKLVVADLRLLAGVPASMRPGPIGPGNVRHITNLKIVHHRFNEARPNWAGKSVGRKWRRAGSRTSFNEARPNWAGKSVPILLTQTLSNVASMRPGPIGPGNTPGCRTGATGRLRLQ